MAKILAALNLAAVMVVVLLGIAQQSMQLSPRHPNYHVLQRINAKRLSYLGIIVTSSANEASLVNSTYFDPSTDFDYAGRKFHIGKIKGVDAIVVNAGGEIPNVVLSTQLLLDLVTVKGIVYFGSAGSVDDNNLFLGDVAVPESVAFTGNWEWKSNTSKRGKLKFGDFNLPTKGANSLGSADFQKVKLYTSGNSAKNYLWLPVDETYLSVALQLDLLLQQCVNEINGTNCVSRRPEVKHGVKGSTADIYLKNKAYGQFLNDRLGVGYVDTSSAAVALTALTNEVPYIVFSGISNSVTSGTSDSNSRYLAAANSIKVAIKFIELLGATNLVSQF